jgi:hypothetical protein
MNNDIDSAASVIKWCFAMILLGIPFFIYETTTAPYHVAKMFGFDIIMVLMACITFIPAVWYILKKD